MMNKHMEICDRLTQTGFLPSDMLIKGSFGHPMVMAFNLTRILRNFDLLDKYPASSVFDNQSIIPSGAQIFVFAIEKDWTTITPQKLIQVDPTELTRWGELPNSVDIIKLELWVSQSDAIMTDITEKIRGVIIHNGD